MKFVLTSVGATLLLVANAMAQLTINTPASAVVCQPLLITWSSGTPPYFLSVVPANQPSAAALINFGTQNGTSLTWLVNIAAGTSIGLDLRDSTGALAQSAPFSIQSGSSTSCVNGNISTSAGTAAATVAATTAAGSSATATNPAATTAAGTTTGKAATTAGSTASATASKAAADHIYVQVGTIGAFAAAILAAMA